VARRRREHERIARDHLTLHVADLRSRARSAASRVPSRTARSARLADGLDLHSQIKVAHWNIKGPQFPSLHPLFETFAVRASLETG
jgi:DNA-binding ferritin-like protein